MAVEIKRLYERPTRRRRLGSGIPRLSGGGFDLDIPAGKQQHRRMTFQRSRQRLGPFHTQTDAVVFDRRDSGLRNPTDGGQFILAQFLQLAKNSD